EAGARQHAHGVEHFVRADGNARGAKDLREADENPRERSGHAATRASSTNSAMRSGGRRAMSSWYLRSAPSVSPTSPGSRAMASSMTRERVQSMGSAPPGA